VNIIDIENPDEKNISNMDQQVEKVVKKRSVKANKS